MSDFLDDLAPKEPTPPDPGPGQQYMQMLAREGKLDPLLAILRAESDFAEMQLRTLLRTQYLNDHQTQAKAVALQGRISAYANLIGKFRGWGHDAKPQRAVA